VQCGTSMSAHVFSLDRGILQFSKHTTEGVSAKPRALPTHFMLKPPLRLRHNIAWTILGTGSYLASQWLILVVLAKLGNPKVVGEYSLALAIVTPLTVLSQLQLRQVIVTDITRQYNYGDYLINRVVLSLLSVVIACVVAISLYPSARAVAVVGLLALVKTADSVSDVCYAQMQKHQRMDYVALSMSMKAWSSIVGFGVTYYYANDLTLAILVVLGISVVLLGVFDAPLAAKHESAPLKLDASRFFALTVLAVPLALAGGLVSFSSNVPRYFLESYHGKEAVALFSVAAAPLSFVTLLQGSITQAVMLRITIHFQKGQLKEFKALSDKITFLFIAITSFFTVIFYVWGETILSTLFTATYADAVSALLIMSGGLAFGSVATTGSYALIAGRRFRMQLTNILIALFVQIMLCSVLIPTTSVTGAAWAELFKQLSGTLILFWFGRSILRNESRHLNS
jgi:O-antigen/teichoic acid export membrane protein